MTGTYSGSWIRRFHPAPPGAPRVVLLPHAGGSASFYFSFSRALSASADVLTIQYPGRQDRLGEPCADNVADLSDAVLGSLLPLLDQPVVLFGHSLGATVAFELARRLEHDKGVVPRCLVVSGRRPPGEIRDEGVHRRDDSALVAELAEMSGTDQRVLAEPELLNMILPTLRSDYRAAETYVYSPGPLISCPVMALVGDDDPKVPVESVANWADYTTGTCEVEVLAGGHFYLVEQQERVVSAITRWLG